MIRSPGGPRLPPKTNRARAQLRQLIKNSNLACEAALEPTEGQRNPQRRVYPICSPAGARGQPDVADGSGTIPAIMTSAIAFMLNPLAAAFCPAAAGPNPEGGTEKNYPLQADPPAFNLQTGIRTTLRACRGRGKEQRRDGHLPPSEGDQDAASGGKGGR